MKVGTFKIGRGSRVVVVIDADDRRVHLERGELYHPLCLLAYLSGLTHLVFVILIPCVCL